MRDRAEYRLKRWSPFNAVLENETEEEAVFKFITDRRERMKLKKEAAFIADQAISMMMGSKC